MKKFLAAALLLATAHVEAIGLPAHPAASALPAHAAPAQAALAPADQAASYQAFGAPVAPDALGDWGPELTDVKCTSPGSCVMIGDYTNAENERVSGLLTMKDGQRTTVPFVAPEGGFQSQVSHLDCSEEGACAAVGTYLRADGARMPMAATSIAGVWTARPVEIPVEMLSATFSWASVSCGAPGFCAAVANYYVGFIGPSGERDGLIYELHDGVVSETTLSLSGALAAEHVSYSTVVCRGESFCAAIADYHAPGDDPRGQLFAVRSADGWTGSTVDWPTDGEYAGRFASLACTGPGACFAAGPTGGSPTESASVLATLKDGAWGTGVLPNLPGERRYHGTNSALRMSCAPDGPCALHAVRISDRDGTYNVIYGWFDGRWNVELFKPPPNYLDYLAGKTRAVQDVSCVADTCTALGTFGDPDSHLQAFTSTSTDGTWEPVSTELPQTWMTAPKMTALSCGAPDSCTAVGHLSRHYADYVQYRQGIIMTSDPIRPSNVIASETVWLGEQAIVDTATIGYTGTWSPTPVTLAYQWYADGVKIDGATSRRIDPPADALGKKLTLSVTGTKPGYAAVTATSVQMPKVTAASFKYGDPVVKGTAKVGAVLSVESRWSPQPDSTSYQWLVGQAPVTGATAATFVVPAWAVGQRVAVKMTVRKQGYRTLSQASEKETVPVQAGTLTAPVPKITGQVKVGATLKVTAGWRPTVQVYKYQWRKNGAPIPKATSRTYKIPASLLGTKISVTVTGSKAGYTSATRTSVQTARVRK